MIIKCLLVRVALVLVSLHRGREVAKLPMRSLGPGLVNKLSSTLWLSLEPIEWPLSVHPWKTREGVAKAMSTSAFLKGQGFGPLERDHMSSFAHIWNICESDNEAVTISPKYG